MPQAFLLWSQGDRENNFSCLVLTCDERELVNHVIFVWANHDDLLDLSTDVGM